MNEPAQRDKLNKSDYQLALIGFTISVVPEIVIIFILFNTSGAPDYFGYYSIFKIGLLYFLAPIYGLIEGWTIVGPQCLPLYLLLLVAPSAAFLLRKKKGRKIAVIILGIICGSIYGFFNLFMISFT